MSTSPSAAPKLFHYVVDTRLSQFTVQAFASGLVSAVAHSPKIAIRDWACEIGFHPNAVNAAFVRARVKTDSLEVLDDLRDNDRKALHDVMKRDVLETRMYPEVIFESSQVSANKLKEDLYKISLTGRLGLHGVTNQLEFGTEASFGPDTLRAHGTFTLFQTHYSIRIASIAGGTMKLRDELKFTFYMIARKQEHLN